MQRTKRVGYQILDESRRVMQRAIRTFAVAAVLIGMASGTACAAAPDDFKIVLSASPRAPGDPFGSQTVEITADGAVWLSSVRTPDGELPERKLKIKNAAVDRIWTAVEEHDFFGLKPEYRDEEIRGGDFAAITVWANGRKHQVKTVNIRVLDFDLITVAINAELPKDRVVVYNALFVEDYTTVQR
ncbi:MAG: hypothetical protein ACE5FO_02635 [Parvularculaceae bacterium]